MSRPKVADADRGLHAVGRVREVRERDSRLGLLQALGSVRAHEARMTALQQALAAASESGAGTLDAYVSSRTLLAAMAASVRDAERTLDAGRAVAADAHARWQADRARVRAIEHLLAERARRRTEEAARAEQREVDDIVGRLHARRQEGVR